MEAEYLLFATREGKVKKTSAEEYENIRQNGLIAIDLRNEDRLLSVHKTNGDNLVLLVTADGKSILFDEEEIRDTGRATQGVKGIDLKEGDYVIGMAVIPKEKRTEDTDYELLVLSENGYGKRTSLAEYNTQGRGGQGVYTAKLSKKTGRLVAMRVIGEDIEDEDEETASKDQDLLVISQHGQTIRLSLGDVAQLGRHTQGVRIIRLNKSDTASALALL